MRILFFLSHPAHFHLFKNIIKAIKKNHEIQIVIKSKDILEKLLDNEGFKYQNILKRQNRSNSKSSILINSIKGLIIRDIKLAYIVLKKRPDVMVGTEWSIAHVGKLFGIPSIIPNEDDTAATPENKYVYPFATTLLMPTVCDSGLWERKKINYEGYHKLAYLHPKYFEPNENVVEKFNPDKEPYFIIRLVNLRASHDTNIFGIAKKILKEIISLLESRGRIFISSESRLDTEYAKYKLNINVNDIHHALFYSTMLISDSQSMSVESAMLGVPSIRYNDFAGKISVLEELEHKYGLTFGIKTSEPKKLINKVEELVNIPNLKKEWKKRRQKMLYDKIDVTAFMIWFIENYPKSVEIMKENPDYQYNFK